NPIFHELHTQMLAEIQATLQPQLRPKYVARLERHLSEGSAWDVPLGTVTLERKEPDVTIAARRSLRPRGSSTATLSAPTVSVTEELGADELELRKQRRIVIYVQSQPRQAVAGIELLSPGNKQPGAVAQERYLEKRASALHGGLHWIEIDLLRGGARPPIPADVPATADYLAYVAQATESGWNHLIYAWGLRDPLPKLPIPLLGADQARLDLGACFRVAFDRIAADDEVDYAAPPPPPTLSRSDAAWIDHLLRNAGLRKRKLHGRRR
ncbi:MAG: DUF4058 family protein, partial [Planctomycetes bacterium]|nr:DUF4058 family protein [Planctomycetota bacterium]